MTVLFLERVLFADIRDVSFDKFLQQVYISTSMKTKQINTLILDLVTSCCYHFIYDCVCSLFNISTCATFRF